MMTKPSSDGFSRRFGTLQTRLTLPKDYVLSLEFLHFREGRWIQICGFEAVAKG
jgi:hypothetical protein